MPIPSLPLSNPDSAQSSIGTTTPNLVIVATSPHASSAIKAVATYEIVKGLVASALAVAVFMWHKKLPDIAAHLVSWLHHVFGHFLISPIDSLNHHAEKAEQNWQLAFWLIIGYAVLRFVEAYGLYKDRTWAYWYSVLGYGIFIPVEMYAIFQHLEAFAIGSFVLNIIIVIVVYLNMKKKGLLGRKIA